MVAAPHDRGGAPWPPAGRALAVVAAAVALASLPSRARAAPSSARDAAPSSARDAGPADALAPPIAALLRDPSDRDRAAAIVARDGALFIGDTDGIRVIGHDDAAADVAAAPGDRAPFADVAWPSSPRLSARARLAPLPASARVVATAGGAPLVVVLPRGVVFAADVAAPANAPLRRWGYLPYLLHVALAQADGRAAPRFAAWRFSPVPHRPAALVWAVLAAALALLLTLAFTAARRHARRHPDAHVAFFARLQAPPSPSHDAWIRPGIARPLGGFFLFISATLLAMGPYLYVTAVLVPTRVQPFPDADGAWAPIADLGTLAWILADAGLSTAFVRFFAAHRVDNPRRALATAQLWVWWQLLAGFAQLVVGGALACGLLPSTHFALFARVVLLRAILQGPGILSFFTFFFQAAQRFDYQLLLDLLQNRLLLVACPIPFVLWLRAVGAAHPSLGEPFGAVMGLAAGELTAALLVFVIGWSLYRRLGLPLAPVFSAGFDGKTASEMLRYGLAVVAGKAPSWAANAVELAIVSTLLPGYLTWLGIRNLIMSRLIFTVYFVWPFIDSAIAALSEAFAADKQKLARYYVVRYLQFGNVFVACVLAVLLGAGRPLVLYALSAEWRPVATYLPLACATAALLPMTWLGDSIFKGAGRPALDAAIVIAEQLLRLALFWILIPRLGFAGIFVTILIALVLKTTVAWLVIHRRIFAVVLWPWSTIGAPLCAGALVYALLTGAALVLPATKAAAVALFAVAALGAFPLGFFLVGALGGFDPSAVDDLSHAAELASAMRPIARALARAGRLGARLVRRRLPALAAEAQAEADAIVALADARR